MTNEILNQLLCLYFDCFSFLLKQTFEYKNLNNGTDLRTQNYFLFREDFQLV